MAKVFVLLLVKIILCFGFSKNALVTLRNGSLYLICRIADLRCFVCDDDDDDDDDGGDDDDAEDDDDADDDDDDDYDDDADGCR